MNTFHLTNYQKIRDILGLCSYIVGNGDHTPPPHPSLTPFFKIPPFLEI